MGPIYAAAELVRYLRSSMPLRCTLPDPITGEPFEIDRDDLLAQLVVDTPYLHQEAQLVAAQYALFSRAKRAAELAAERADFQYARWKAQQGAYLRSKGKATVAEVEEFYRGHEDYERMSAEGAKLRALAGMLEDVQKAFQIKSNMIKEQYGALRGSNSVHATEDRVPETWRVPNGPPPAVYGVPEAYKPKG